MALALLACAARGASAQTAASEFAIDVAIDPIRNRVYVANRDGDNVRVVEGSQLTSQLVSVADEPVAIAVDPVAGVIWVASDAGAAVTRIDASTLSTAPVALGAGAVQIAVDPSTSEAWVATDAGSVVRIDAALATESAGVPGASFLAVDWVAGRVWVAGTQLSWLDTSDLSVHAVSEVTAPGGIALDPAADRVCASRPGLDQLALLTGVTFDRDVATGDQPEVVAIDPLAGRFYAVNRGSENVTRIESDLATSTAAIGSAVGAVVANPNTGHLHVLEPSAAAVAVVTATAVAHHPISASASSAALNPVTNRLYVANSIDDTIDAVDTAALSSTQIDAGTGSNAVAVDVQRGLVFVTNSGDDDVSIVDSSTQTVVDTVAVGDLPVAVAVDPVRGIAYVANAGSDTVTAITQGPSGPTPVTISVGARPVAIAVNPVTGAAFVANYDADSVTRILPGPNGFATATRSVGDGPVAIAVDPGANRVFVANNAASTVTRLDGATLLRQTIPVNGPPTAIAIDPRDGVAYVASPATSAITAIEGLTTTSIGEVVGASSLVLDPVQGRIYAANSLADDVSAIDLATGATKRIPVGPEPFALVLDSVASRVLAIRNDAMRVIDGVSLTASPIPDAPIGSCLGIAIAPAFDPIGGRSYVPSCPGGAVAVIGEERQSNPLTVSISGDVGVVETTTPSLAFVASNAFAPNAPPVTGIYYQVDSWMGPWTAVAPSGAAGSATLSLTPGQHVVYAFAVDGHESASSASPASVALVGAIAAEPILVVPAPEPAAAALALVAIAAVGGIRRFA